MCLDYLFVETNSPWQNDSSFLGGGGVNLAEG